MNKIKYSICVIDDDSFALSFIIQAVERIAKDLNFDFECDTFDDEHFKLIKHYDLFIIDIVLGDYTGFDIVKNYSEYMGHSKIVFATQKEENVFKSFEYHPYGFVRKKYLTNDLKRIFERCLEEERKIIIPMGKDVIKYIYQKDILYFSIYKNTLSIVCNNMNYSIRRTLKQIEGDLIINENDSFARINQSEILNISSIVTITRREIILKDGTKHYISKKYLKRFYKKYYNYLAE